MNHQELDFVVTVALGSSLFGMWLGWKLHALEQRIQAVRRETTDLVRPRTRMAQQQRDQRWWLDHAPHRQEQRIPVVKPAANSDRGDVIAALVSAGYKKQVASAMADLCATNERASVETWVAAALHKTVVRS